MTVRTPGTWDGRSGTELAAAWGAPLVEAYSTLGSTNDRALELARDGASRGTVVVAEEQTAGRGRRGASWQSSPGVGLWMTVVLGPDDVIEQLPLVVGVACARSLETEVPEARIDIKWPNDLLIDGRKVGGILCEASGGVVVAGIGINIAEPKTGFDQTISAVATTLEVKAGRPLSRKALATSVLHELMAVLAAPEPYLAVAGELAGRDAFEGRRVRTEQEGEGTARGFDSAGRLLLERPDGTRVAIVSGGVHALDRGSNEPPNGRH